MGNYFGNTLLLLRHYPTHHITIIEWPHNQVQFTFNLQATYLEFYWPSSFPVRTESILCIGGNFLLVSSWDLHCPQRHMRSKVTTCHPGLVRYSSKPSSFRMAKFLEKDFLFRMFSRSPFDNTQGELDDDMHEILFGQKTRQNPKQKVSHHEWNRLISWNVVKTCYNTLLTTVLHFVGFDNLATTCGFVPSLLETIIHKYKLLVWPMCHWAHIVMYFFWSI